MVVVVKHRSLCAALQQLRGVVSWAVAPLLGGCIEFSPFETDLADGEEDQTRENLAAIAALADPGDRFRFAVVADSHQYADELTTIVAHINDRSDIAFVAHLGDMTDLGLREEYRITLAALEGLRVPFVTVIGNHDAVSNGKTLYQNMFGPYDYSFDYGFARFVCFNSNTLEFGAAPDLVWLAEHASKADGTARVVALSHQPSRSPDYAQVLTEVGADALVTAHQHSWGLSGDRGLLEVAVASALSGRWAVVHVSRSGLALEKCERNSCVDWNLQ